MKKVNLTLLLTILLLMTTTSLVADPIGKFRNLKSEIELATKKLERDSKKTIKVKRPLPKSVILRSWEQLDNWSIKIGKYQQTFAEHEFLPEIINAYNDFESKFEEILDKTNSLSIVDEIATDTKMAPKRADKPELIEIAKNLLKDKQGEIQQMYIVKDIFKQNDQGWDSHGDYYNIEWDEFHIASIEKIGDIKWYRYYQFQKTTKSARSIKYPDWRYVARLTNKPILDKNIQKF